MSDLIGVVFALLVLGLAALAFLRSLR